MNWASIVTPIVITTVIGIIGFFMKRAFDNQAETNREMISRFGKYQTESNARIDDLEKRLTDTIAKNQERIDKRVEDLERRVSENIEKLPFRYVLRDDYIRTMGNFETKLNKILELMRGKDGGSNG